MPEGRDPTAVVRKFCESFPVDIAALHVQYETVIEDGQLNMQRLKELHMEAHRIGGAALCMGFRFVGEELGQIEAELQRMLDGADEDTVAHFEYIGQKLAAVRRLQKHVVVENSRMPQPVAAKSHLKSTDNSGETGQPLSQHRILVVDDDRSIRTLVKDILLSIGVGEVHTATSGEDALRQAPGIDPTIIISDWMMQPIDGMQLLSLIRKGESALSKDTRVIFLTSQNNVSRVRSAIREGVDHFLIKPFSQAVIANAVAKVAARALPVEENETDSRDVVAI